MTAQLTEHLVKNYLFEPCQSAYRQHHSTETALLHISNDLLEAIDNKKICILGPTGHVSSI